MIVNEQDLLRAMQGANDGETNDRDLFWNIVSYQEWLVPLNNDAPELNSAFDLAATRLLKNPEGEHRLALFSSVETYDNFAAGRKLKLEATTGCEIFIHDLPEILEVILDPGCNHECSLESEVFPYVKELAEGIRVERLWQALAQGYQLSPDELNALAQHPGYHLIGLQSDQGMKSIQVPHDDGRYFFPVFTYPHARQLGLEHFQKSESPDLLKTVKLAGNALFPALANETMDGIVLNFRGPGDPIGLTTEIISLMLNVLKQ